ncbi:hypothetical protein [Sphingomonas abietis]|uniref:Uncharacterized protein n=1 Tax=Sphingomonas abietis TaxID=3012344 RepID=A0ABY7NVX3_9SPHN|nr:hypothetical protein [Sphingomonas abietis]WBO24586.1 hypothetical protein PBT88_08230 [Sphingomonas abietis]
MRVLRDAQEAVNVAFGAILSAYVGNSLAEIDNHAFDHAVLARFFVLLAVFILGLTMGNSALVRGEWQLGLPALAVGWIAAGFAHHEGQLLGFEASILRLIAFCWFGALIASDAILSAINYFHHRIGS